MTQVANLFCVAVSIAVLIAVIPFPVYASNSNEYIDMCDRREIIEDRSNIRVLAFIIENSNPVTIPSLYQIHPFNIKSLFL